MLTVILLGAALICFLTALFTYGNQAQYKNGMLFAVLLPADAAGHEEFRTIRARFKKRFMLTSFVLAAGLVLLAVLHRWFAYQLVGFFVWLLVFVAAMGGPFRRAFRETLEVKRRNHWFVGPKRVVHSDLRAAVAKNQRAAPLWLFLIPFGMAAAAMWWAGRSGIPLVAGSGGLLLTVLLLLLSVNMRRTKAKVYSMNSEVNVLLNQAKRRALSYLYVVLAIMENIHALLLSAFFRDHSVGPQGVWVAGLILFSAFPAGMIYYVYRNHHKLEREVLSQDGKVVYTDDDEYWANGFTYHNPNDNSVFVTKRVGIGETINTATTAGKWMAGGVIGITLAVIIGVSFMVIRSEMTSPELTVTSGGNVDIHYPMYSYSFPLADVEQVSLVEQVPSGTKTNGEATGQYARGHFRLAEVGKTRLYIYKNNPPYIQIKLKDLYIYYNEQDPAETRRIYGELQAAAK